MAEIDPRLDDMLEGIATATGEPRFALCGGAVLDTLLGLPVKDYDIIIDRPKAGDREVEQVADHLAGQGFEIIDKSRLYYVWINTPSRLIEARRDTLLYDIGFAPYSVIPYFTADSMYVTYPDRQVVDDYDAMGAYRRQEIELARGIDQENPFMTAGRALNLAAKYGMPLERAAPLLGALVGRMEAWEPPHAFHEVAAQEASWAVLRAIARSRDAQAFASDLLTLPVLDSLLPEVHRPLQELCTSSPTQWPSSAHRLAGLLIRHMDEAEVNSFGKRVGQEL